MAQIIKIICLSTAQELVNFIGIVALVRHYAMKPEEVCVDVLQTASARSLGWAENLRVALAGRGLDKVQFVPLQELGIEGDAEYNPMRIFRALETRYESQAGLMYWLYSGAQKAQSAGMAVYGILNAQQDSGLLVSVEQNGHIHIIKGDDHEVIEAGLVDFRVRESILLYGGAQREAIPARLLKKPGNRIFPSEQIVSWEHGCPEGSKAIPTLPDFMRSMSERHAVYNWPSEFKVSSGGEKSEAGPLFFEFALAWRVQEFLRNTETHNVSEVVRDLGKDPQFDLVIAKKDGGIIVIDAKMGGKRASEQEKYRPQEASAKKIGGSRTEMYYCIPWFPDYLDSENHDVLWNYTSGAEPHKDNHVASRNMYEGLLGLWRSTDQDYGPGWDPVAGQRPPDDSGHGNFGKSRIIPFDAGILFEQKLEALLCQ